MNVFSNILLAKLIVNKKFLTCGGNLLCLLSGPVNNTDMVQLMTYNGKSFMTVVSQSQNRF